MTFPQQTLSDLLEGLRAGHGQASDELHRLAARQRRERGGRYRHAPLHKIEAAPKDEADSSDAQAEALAALDQSLHRLDAHDRRQSRIVECRFFGGMTIEETAEALGISPATVKRGRTMAQAWLFRDLSQVLEGSA